MHPRAHTVLTRMCYGFALCTTPLAAGALKAAGGHARAILLTAREDIQHAAFTTFGSAALMVMIGGLLLPSFIWRSATRHP